MPLGNLDGIGLGSTVEALGRISDIKVVPHLIKFLDDEDEFIKIYTIKALGKFNDIRAIEPLENIRLNKKTSKSVKKYTKETLDKIKFSDAYKEHLLSASGVIRSDKEIEWLKPDREIEDLKRIFNIESEIDESEKSEVIGKAIQKKFSHCPYCGQKLLSEKTPTICPYCEELLIIE